MITFEYQTFGFQMDRYSNGPSMSSVLYQYIRKQNGVHVSGIQMVKMYGIQNAFECPTIWRPTSFWPFKFQISSVFRSRFQIFWQNGRHFVRAFKYWTIWNSNKRWTIWMDSILFSHVLVWTAQKPTIWIPNHLKSDLQKVWYSNASDLQMVCTVTIWIPNIWIQDSCQYRTF